ncbi:MAG: hypothetical protein ACTSXH_00790 [Promethearchaeota archaeon]
MGKNNAGKSNLTKILKFLKDYLTGLKIIDFTENYLFNEIDAGVEISSYSNRK